MNQNFQEILFSLVLNTVAVGILSFALYFKRHRRRELATGYIAFAFSLFVVSLSLSIANSPIGIGLGFGLFAILSIVRLRSDEATWNEIGYTMVSIVIGLLNGLTVLDFDLKIILSTILLISMFVADHPKLYSSAENLRVRIIVDQVIINTHELTLYLGELLNGEVKDFIILEIDNVRETMLIDVRLLRNE